MKRVWLVFCCLLTLTACAVDPRARTAPAVTPLPPVTHPKVESPDRNPTAVLSAVRRLDPCALLDPGEARLPGVPAGTPTKREAPFHCRLDIENYKDYQVYLTIVDLPTEERLELSTEPIGGMRSYRTAENNACAVYLPISFRLSVEITAEQLDGDVEPCDQAGAVAEQVVARLGAPEQVESEPRWDACTVLATALNVDMANVSAKSEWDVSSCESDEANLRLRDADEFGEVDDDTPVQVDDDYRGVCLVSANAGGVAVSVTHPSCDEAKRIAGPVMEIVAAPPPAGEPQRPVLYPWDEPDVPNPVCRSVADPTCQPYIEVPVPEGPPLEVLRHALADPNIQCALAAEVLDAELTPVTVGTECHFVGAGAPTVSTYLQAGSSYVPGSEETEVDGRPAELRIEEKYGYLLVALAENLPGDVVLIVSMRADTEGQIKEQTLRTVAEEILDRHFS